MPTMRQRKGERRRKAKEVAGSAKARARQLLFVQGGGSSDTHDAWDDKLVASLRQALGPAYTIRYPRMPDEASPNPAAWRRAIARELGKLRDGVFLVGHSIGAAILMDYLADGTLERRLEGVFLIAMPFIGDGGWPSEDLRPTRQVARALHDGAPLYFYQGGEDETVPVPHLEMLAATFPDATVRRLEGRNHQLNDDLSEVARDIARLAAPRAEPGTQPTSHRAFT
jgi:predicted alpha/beta hydrolase family esterase